MKKNLVVKQDGYKECGVACLLSIIRYYGGNIPISMLLELTNTTKEGTTFLNLKNTAFLISFQSNTQSNSQSSSLMILRSRKLERNLSQHFLKAKYIAL